MPEESWKLVFLDAATFDRGDVELSRFTERFDCTFHRVTAPGQTAERLRGFHAAVTNKVPVGAELMDSAKESLKLIAVAATGTNNVALDAAKERGIPVCNVAGYSSHSVAQHAFGLILELASHCGRYSMDNRLNDAWSKSDCFTRLAYPCVELSGKTLGLIGHGAIGQQTERIALGFGMRVLIGARPGLDAVPPGRVALGELFEHSDIISLHCPLTPETKNLIGAPELARMKPNAFLINTARGGIVNEAALIEALRKKQIAGAGFDVAGIEPCPADHPMMRAVRELDNLILTPHSAWSTLESRQRLLDEVFENICAFARGEERNRVA